MYFIKLFNNFIQKIDLLLKFIKIIHYLHKISKYQIIFRNKIIFILFENKIIWQFFFYLMFIKFK